MYEQFTDPGPDRCGIGLRVQGLPAAFPRTRWLLRWRRAGQGKAGEKIPAAPSGGKMQDADHRDALPQLCHSRLQRPQ